MTAVVSEGRDEQYVKQDASLLSNKTSRGYLSMNDHSPNGAAVLGGLRVLGLTCVS